MLEEDQGIFEGGASYNGLGHDYDQIPIKDLANNSTSQPSLYNYDLYSVINDHDPQSVSNVDNLGMRSDKNAKFYLGGESVPPELPKRDYGKHTPREVQAGVLVKKQSSKKQRAPQPPDREPIDVYITRFRGELFKGDGVIVSVNKTDLSPKTIKLVSIADCICIAALPGTKLRSSLHIDDVIVKVNQQTVSSIKFCYKLFGTTDENKVQLLVKRVMHGIMCHVTLSANGDVDSLGLEFGNQSQGNEVTAIDNSGLVAKSRSPSRPQTHGVVNGGILVNWSLVEINQSPVALDSSPKEVLDQIRQSGCELALVFIPVDVTNVFREKSRQVTEHTSENEYKC
nr:uncharacterized protein LOC129278389 [Lytechinus pictus]